MERLKLVIENSGMRHGEFMYCHPPLYAVSYETRHPNVNSCSYVTSHFKIDYYDFLDWNPSLASMKPCVLQPNYSYCVQSDSDYIFREF